MLSSWKNKFERISLCDVLNINVIKCLKINHCGRSEAVAVADPGIPRRGSP